ncbi:MAG: SDR family NAD(P)-dependent oxidoreductase [Acidobacteriota bacterium]
MVASRVAIVTGAARGIGLAIARRLYREGAAVVLADRDVEAARRRVDEFGQRGLAAEINVADPADARRLAEVVLERFGRIDILVNNAGITGQAAPTVTYRAEEWRRVMAINQDGVFYCTQAVLPHMLERGQGRIVNVSSISGKEGNPNMAAYSTSKAAVIGFTKALGKELAQTGVLVNCVTPAVIATEILDQLTQETVDYMVSKIPMGRTGSPEEVAALVAWLCSEDCSFSTGAVFDISGGRATY